MTRHLPPAPARLRPALLRGFMLAWLICPLPALGAGGGLIEGVAVQPEVLDVASSASATIRFQVSAPGVADVLIHDAHHFVVRRLAEGRPVYPGTNTVDWDGRDDAGRLVPDEAYTFVLAVDAGDGGREVHDPAMESGGERIVFTHHDLVDEPGAGRVVYRLPYPARVQIRAGVYQGPLLKSILDWAPRPAGEFSEPWDGLDATGRIDVRALEGFLLSARAFRLPEHSIIVRGSPTPPSDPLLEKPAKDTGDKAVVEARAAALERMVAVEKSLAVRERPIEPHAMIAHGLRRLPEFEVSPVGPALNAADGAGPPVVSGTLPLRVELSPETHRRLTRQRFEIVYYVDYVMLGEQEQGYSPYTLELDTRRLTNGDHVVTINVAGLQDQLNAWSLPVVVSNPASND